MEMVTAEIDNTTFDIALIGTESKMASERIGLMIEESSRIIIALTIDI